ncbi:MAG: hypothetical protein NC339_04955 [Muribaculaceae bacterium]|nr:hypothetical protein [Muribaculaceae bacterium]
MTTEIYRSICSWLRQLVNGTEWDGHLFAVGGCCRDEVMGYPIKDLDMAVDIPDGGIAFAQWLEEKGLVKGEITTFPRFGTARLELKDYPNDEVELVQTRREKYTDRNSRCPETAFGTIEEDCMRRDLTINSLYYDICRDRFVDITGLGLHDIEHHIIRTPSDPDVTFDDDPVRIYRTIRFAARFGWDIAPDTYEGILRNIHRLSIVTPTRCHSELERMLTGPNNTQALNMLMETGAMQYLLPEVAAESDQPQSPPQMPTVWQQTVKVMENLGDAPLPLLMAGLLHLVGKPVMAEENEAGKVTFPNYDQTGSGITRKILRRLRCLRPFIDEVDFLVRHHTWTFHWGDKAEKMKDRQLRKLQYVCRTPERFYLLMRLIEADNMARLPGHCIPDQVSEILKRSRQMEADGTAMFGYQLPLSALTIKRLKRIRTDRDLKRCKDYLLKMAFIDPRRSVHEFKRLLLAFN